MSKIDATVLGDLAGFIRAVTGSARAERVGSEERGDVVIEDLLLSAGAGEPIPAYLTRPRIVQTPAPAVLYCHAHGNDYGIGRRELVEGRAALQTPPYGQALAEEGFVTLCLEMPAFGARADIPETALYKALLWQGKTLFGQMLSELSLGLDYLLGREEVDGTRVAAMGMSMGCTHAFWLGALDPRIGAVAHLCCFASMRELVRTGAHDIHGHYMTVPGLLDRCDTGDIAALIAPRPQLICVGMKDELTPQAGFEIALSAVRTRYDECGAAERLSVLVEDEAGHEETPAMRRAVLDFLGRFASAA